MRQRERREKTIWKGEQDRRREGVRGKVVGDKERERETETERRIDVLSG